MNPHAAIMRKREAFMAYLLFWETKSGVCSAWSHVLL